MSPVAPGTRLGSFEITSKLGEGGMGEVWRATDTRLDREVALKVLPAAFTADKERLARFEREAKLLAQLNHPNIAQIYGLETSDDIRALVMELVQGPTLAERLESGAFSITESLSAALQIAQALEEAHEKGIVHRDLKPQNVKASSEGKVKVLDFGLAKAMDATGAPTAELANSPTLTAVRGTELGTILGTAAYMAPEQARGRTVDKRVDIWAFGVVFYEMLTGERLFAGESVVDTLSAVLTKEIDLTRLPAELPPRLRELVRRCLERDPKRRLRDIGEARLLIERLLAGAPESATGGPAEFAVAALAPGAPVAARLAGTAGTAGSEETAWKVSTPSRSFLITGRRLGIAAAIAGAALIGLAAGRSMPSSDPVHRSAKAIRAAIALPPGLELDGVGAPEIALSPDGSTLAFLARGESGPQHHYVRRLDGDGAKLVPGSESAEGPFFSPDGNWVAFAVGVSGLGGGIPRELRKQSLESGLTQTIAPIQDYFGGVWRDDGTIFFIDASDGTVASVPASGGKPTLAAARNSDRGEPRSVSLFWPELLPDGGALVLSTPEHPGGELAVLDLGSGVLTRLGVHGMSPRYLPTGHLAFGGENGSLEVVPFDAEERRVLGAPVAALAGIARARNRSATFAVATDGTLVYATGYLSNSRHEPMRVVRASRDGRFETLAIEPDLFGRAIAATPDGGRLALAREDRGGWVVDLARGTRTKVAGDEVTGAMDVAWSADGDQLAWSAKPPEGDDVAVLVQPSDGRGAPRALGVRDSDLSVAGWMPDGRELVVTRWGVSATIERVPLAGKSEVVWRDPGSLGYSDLSPDGQLVAFESDAGEGYEVYLYSFAMGERTPVTAGGGRSPFWSHDGRELFFRRGSGIHAAEISTASDGSLRIGRETRLFDWPAAYKVVAGADGSFFGTEPVPGTARQTSLQLQTRWFESVRRLAPVGNGR
ncbi:MAG: eukaryotic-like serine/threonine-protein kinase [Acidobacteriota bacterium]|nr:eukaryotic-like serine/threonine-protein kinase [Acidobacteriota bacterium]